MKSREDSNGDTKTGFRAGDWVEVLSREEILRTLDRNGQLEGMPFMPEMFESCGKRFRIYKRAHKTCDTVWEYKARKLKDSVHLEGLRCNGSGHGGCEAACLIYWKMAWLRPAGEPAANGPAAERPDCTEADVIAASRKPATDDGKVAYVCQATQVPAATEPLSPWSLEQYVEDYKSGNVTLGRFAKSFLYVTYRRCFVNLGIGIGPTLMWIYDQVQKLRKGTPYPSRGGKLPVGGKTPAVTLNLQPGEWVRVKSYNAIRATCTENDMNRGMKFDPEMVPYCGGTYKVLKQVSRILNEQTGQMQEMKTPCIILDTVVCQARFCDNRLFCPRSVYPYWREIWLERVEKPESPRGREQSSGSLIEIGAGHDCGS